MQCISFCSSLPADGEVVSLEICESLKTLAGELAKDSHHAKKIRVEVGEKIFVQLFNFTCFFVTLCEKVSMFQFLIKRK